MSTLGLRPARIAMRPNTSNRTPQTISDVVDDPVAGIVPVDEPVGLPPELALVLPPVTGVVAPTTTKDAVRWALVVPVIVTV